MTGSDFRILKKTAKLPAWDDVERSFRGIFDRQYYTENGPLVRQLEGRLGESTGFSNVICVANEMVGYLILLDQIDGPGRVLACDPARAVARDAPWWFSELKVTVVESASALLEKLSDGLSLGSPPVKAVVLPAQQSSVELILSIKDAMNGTDALIVQDCTQAPLTGCSGADVHICSMHESTGLMAVEGAYIATDKVEMADRMRTMRSSSGIVRPARVKKTLNGRMSEAHAAFALLSLESLLEGRLLD